MFETTILKALPETIVQNGPPSREAKVKVVTTSVVDAANKFATTSTKYPRRAAPVIELEHGY